MPSSFPFKIGTNSTGLTELNGGTLPAIHWRDAKYSRQTIDSEATGRNAQGEMIRDVVAYKDKWQLKFVPSTQSQVDALLAILDNSEFYFISPMNSIAKKCYCGDRSMGVLQIRNGNVTYYEDFSVDIIEI